MSEALPKRRILVNDVNCDALIDTGCTKSIVHAPLCSRWTKGNVCVTTVSGERFQCVGSGEVQVKLLSGAFVTVSALVVPFKPLNYDFILGMNCVRALHGVTVRSATDVRFGIEDCEASAAVTTKVIKDIDEKDFKVTYDPKANTWTVLWKWSRGAGPARLQNTVSQYSVPREARREYENELHQWVEDGWLVPYDESVHGPVKGTVPLMAVVQQNKRCALC